MSFLLNALASSFGKMPEKLFLFILRINLCSGQRSADSALKILKINDSNDLNYIFVQDRPYGSSSVKKR